MNTGILISRPYARAAFAWAKETHSLEQWENLLSLLAHISREKAFHAVIHGWFHPSVTARLIVELLGEAFDVHAENFVTLLSENKRLQFAPDILKFFLGLRDRDNNTQSVTFSTAIPLKSAQKAHFQARLETQLQTKVRIQWCVDAALRSGLVLRIGDRVVDASGLGRLHALTQALQIE